MNEGHVLEIVQNAMILAAKLVGPILVVCLAIGVIVALLQTITQIQEATLTFVPKLIGAGVVLLAGGHWMIQSLTQFVTQLWRTIPQFG